MLCYVMMFLKNIFWIYFWIGTCQYCQGERNGRKTKQYITISTKQDRKKDFGMALGLAWGFAGEAQSTRGRLQFMCCHQRWMHWRMKWTGIQAKDHRENSSSARQLNFSGPIFFDDEFVHNELFTYRKFSLSLIQDSLIHPITSQCCWEKALFRDQLRVKCSE